MCSENGPHHNQITQAENRAPTWFFCKNQVCKPFLQLPGVNRGLDTHLLFS